MDERIGGEITEGFGRIERQIAEKTFARRVIPRETLTEPPSYSLSRCGSYHLRTMPSWPGHCVAFRN